MPIFKGGRAMDNLKTVVRLCQDHGIDAKQLAQKSGLDEQRVFAIVLGRWTPSPEERDKVAAVFGLTRDQIVWGHSTPIQHIYGHGPS
jgi:cyanate lyase